MATTADVTITPVLIVPGTETADLVGAGASVTAAQTFRILVTNPISATYPPARGGETKIIIVVEEQGSGAATITFEAGDATSLQAVKGTDAIVLAQSDLRMYVLEAGRHLKTDGYIKALVSTNTVKVFAFVLPAGY